MSNPQLVEIDRSLHAIVRRAYDLGRDDALQKVVDVIRADKSCGDRLALMAPETSVLDQNMANGGAANPDVPWWARRAR